MNTNCCVSSVPHHGSFKAFPKAVAAWQEGLQAGLSRNIEASDETMSHWEEEIRQKTQEGGAGRLWGHKYYGDMLNGTPVFAGYFGGACPHNS